jgi:predicted lipase
MITPLTSVRLSAISYSDKIKSLDKFRHVKKVVNEDTNSTCTIYRKRSEVVITFEGTDSWKDIPILFSFDKDKVIVKDHEDEKIKVHTGFLKAYLSMHDEIVKVLDGMTFKTIHCTGHSLGGALAEISTLFLHEKAMELSVHTFAAPAIGNRNASRLAHDLCTDFKRFVIKGDYVPLLPPFFMGYWHHTDMIQLDRVNSKIIDHYIYSAINDHKVLNYMKSIMIYTMENQATVEYTFGQ